MWWNDHDLCKLNSNNGNPLFSDRTGNLEMLVFVEGGKPKNPEKKTLGARTRTNNKLNPHMTPGPGIEPGPQWRDMSALNTALSPLPKQQPITATVELRHHNEILKVK